MYGFRSLFLLASGLAPLVLADLAGARQVVRLNAPLAPDHDVLQWSATRDGRRIVYSTGLESGSLFRFFVVPADGSQPAVPLTDPMTPELLLESFVLSPDGQRLVFLARNGTLDSLMSVRLNGAGDPILLNVDGDAQRGVNEDYQITADGQDVIYVARESPQAAWLFRVPIEGGASTVLSTRIYTFLSSLGGRQFLLAEGPAVGGARVLYPAPFPNVGNLAIYSVPVDASSEEVLLAAGFGQYTLRLSDAELTSDQAFLVYRAHLQFARTEVIATPVDGSSPPFRVFPDLGPITGFDFQHFAITPDDRFVLATGPGGEGLHAASLDGLVPPYVIDSTNSVVSSPMAFSRDSRRIVYPMRNTGVRTASIDASEPPLEVTGFVRGRYPGVLGDQAVATTFGLRGLIRFALDGSSGALPLTPTFVQGGEMLEDSGRFFDARELQNVILYRATQNESSLQEAFLVPVDGSRPPVRLHPELVTGGDVHDVGFSPLASDTLRVFYRADQDEDDVIELFTRRVVANAGPRITIDFETAGSPGYHLSNGAEITCSTVFDGITCIEGQSASGLGAAIFDSNPTGPNQFSQDDDLLVDSGNLLILQKDSTQSVPGVYDFPNDDPGGGLLRIVFEGTTRLISIDLIDICPDPGQAATVTLIDADGETARFDVPSGWTEDVAQGGPGWRTLQLFNREPQVGFQSEATCEVDFGFDHDRVRELTVRFSGSGAIDNVVFEPVLDRSRPIRRSRM